MMEMNEKLKKDMAEGRDPKSFFAGMRGKQSQYDEDDDFRR